MTEPSDDDATAGPTLTRRTAIKGTAAGAGALGLGVVPSVGAAQQSDASRMGFRVRVENVSTPETLSTPDGSVAVPLSPGAYAVHDPAVSLFRTGAAASEGLEALAEDGTPGDLAGELAGVSEVSAAGTFAGPETVSDPNQPDGAPEPPIFPGGAFEFVVPATPGDRLSFATMFVQSNDLFLAPGPDGIDLFEDGSPVGGDVTDQVMLWDAGTEIDQQPGTGPDQAPRQSSRDTGAADDDTSTVRAIADANSEGYDYPAVDEVIRVTVTAVEPTPFRVRLDNVSTPETLSTPDGSAAVPLSPGAYAVHDPSVALFETGEAASPGLEALAEDGTPGGLAGELAGVAGVRGSGAFALDATLRDPNQPDGAPAPPIFPGGAFEFVVHALPGDRLSFATMFVQSNDLFLAPGPDGIDLFEDGSPVGGDVTDQVMLWDAGTEIDQQPGTGPDQAPRQPSRDTGAADDDTSTVRAIADANSEGYDYPAVDEVIRVGVEPGTGFSLATYTTPRGTVTSEGFRRAVRDWARDNLTTDQLRRVLSAFVTGETVD